MPTTAPVASVAVVTLDAVPTLQSTYGAVRALPTRHFPTDTPQNPAHE